MIKIEYTYSPQDFRATTLELLRPGLRLRLILLAVAIAYVGFFSMLPLLNRGESLPDAARLFGTSFLTGREPVSTYLLFLGTALAIWFIHRLAVAIRAPISAASACKLIGTQTVTLAEDGVEARDASAESKVRWTVFRKVIVTPDYLILVIRTPIARILPRRGFASAADFEAALAYISLHVNKDTPVETR